MGVDTVVGVRQNGEDDDGGDSGRHVDFEIGPGAGDAPDCVGDGARTGEEGGNEASIEGLSFKGASIKGPEE